MPRNEQPVIQPINNKEYILYVDFNFYFKARYGTQAGVDVHRGFIDRKGELTVSMAEGYTTDGTVRIHVPAKEKTDGASVPSILWSTGYSAMGDHLAGSTMHDMLYQYRVSQGVQVKCIDSNGNITWVELEMHGEADHRRLFADKMFLMGMEEFQSAWAKRTLFYQSVRRFGGGAY